MTNSTTLPLNEGVKVITVSKEEVMARRKDYLQREQDFFNYWKKGVEIGGYRYFGDGTKENFEQATEKNQLSPVSAKIEASLGGISDGEAAFLVAMYCFYNDFKGAELCAKAGVKSIGNLMVLDSHRREVIAGLLITYCGW